MQDTRSVVRGPVVLDDRYLVVRMLRADPRGDVFLVREVALGDWRALVVPAAGAADGDGLLRAARARAASSDDALLHVHEVLGTRGLAAVVTELAPGGTVAGWIARHGPVPPRRVVEIGLRLAGAWVPAGPLALADLELRADGSVALGALSWMFPGPPAEPAAALVPVLRRLAQGDAAHEVAAPLADALAACSAPGTTPTELRRRLAEVLPLVPEDAGRPPPLVDLPEDPFASWEDGVAMDALRDRLAEPQERRSATGAGSPRSEGALLAAARRALAGWPFSRRRSPSDGYRSSQ